MTKRVERPHLPRGRPARPTWCAWVDDSGELCHTFGPVVKGLCPAHYSQLTRDLRADGIRYRTEQRTIDEETLPTTCQCREPDPQQVRFLGVVLVDDCYQCGRCGRAVL